MSMLQAANLSATEITTVLHTITAATILAFKITTLVVGYKITKLGYDLMLKGITGGFEFSGQYAGVKGGLISSSPGLLFLLMGVVLMYAGVTSGSFETTVEN